MLPAPCPIIDIAAGQKLGKGPMKFYGSPIIGRSIEYSLLDSPHVLSIQVGVMTLQFLRAAIDKQITKLGC